MDNAHSNLNSNDSRSASLNHIKNKRRSQLTPAHMDDIMRIRLNSVDELEKFPAARYAKQFLKENHIRTDDPKWKKKVSESLVDLDPTHGNKKFLPKISFL